MNPSRLSLLAAGTVLTALFALATGSASACPGQEGGCACAKAAAAASGADAHGEKKACACAPGDDGKCACGAECPSNHGGECTHGKAAGAAPAPGSCGSCGACGGGAAAPGGANLKAAIDPATGQLVEPADDDAAPAALATGDGEPAKEVQQPGGGVMVAAPAELAPKAVATIDDSGKAHSGCAE